MSLNERDQQIKDAALKLCEYDGFENPHHLEGWDSPAYRAQREIKRFLFILELAQKVK